MEQGSREKRLLVWAGGGMCQCRGSTCSVLARPSRALNRSTDIDLSSGEE